MKRKSMVLLLLLTFLSSCAPKEILAPYSNVRIHLNEVGAEKIIPKGTFQEADIATFSYSDQTVFKGSETVQQAILENAKNPGLGVRSLHEAGITGAGVTVAIIDQHLQLDHPEFQGKIVEYHDTGCERPAEEGSMHAPAVTSLLAGETIGTAPGVKIYFAATPGWLGDAKYCADALDWILSVNAQLPEDEKIRLVSVSANLSETNYAPFQNSDLWAQAVQRAQAAGILVLDGRDDDQTGFIGAAYYDESDRENPALCKLGYPNGDEKGNVSHGFTAGRYILAPASQRTVAEEYVSGKCQYAYTGSAGLSWAIPYAAGVLALGWQVNPELTKEEIVTLLRESACLNAQGYRVIDPVAFVDRVKQTLDGAN